MRPVRSWLVGGIVIIILFAAAVALSRTARTTNQEALKVSGQYVQHGIQLYKQQAYPEAIFQLRQALDTNPQEWQAPYYMAVIEIDFKQYNRAIPYLEQAFSLNPAEAQVPYALGVCYYKLGRLDMARGYFAAALELDPTNDDAKALFEAMAKIQRDTRLAQTAKEN